MTTSLMNEPAINCDVAYGVLEQRSGDIYSFLTGTRPRTLEQPEVDFGGFYSSFRDANNVSVFGAVPRSSSRNNPREKPVQCSGE